MSWNFSSKVRLVLALISLSICVIGGVATFNILKLEDSTEWIQQSHRVIQSLQKVNSDYKGIQASYAEYLLTQKETYAKTCRKEIENAHADLVSAKTLLSDDSILQSWFTALESQVGARMKVSERGLGLCQAGLWDTAILELKLVNEKKGTQDVKDLVNHMATAQAWMLKSRLSLESLTTHRSVRFIVVGLIFTLLICAGAAFFVMRQAIARQRTINLLRSSEEKLHFLSDTANDTFLTLDSSGTVVDLNPSAEIMFGCDRAELTHHPFSQFLSKKFLEESGPDPFKSFLDLTLTTGLRTLEFYLQRKDGVEFPVEISVSKWTGREGTFYSLIARDITDRKFFVKTLLTNEHRLFQFLDAVPVGILVRDKLGMHYFANKTAREILGRDIQRDRVTPQDIPDIYRLFQAGTDDLYPAEKLPMIRALAGEKSHLDDMEIRRADRTVPVESWGTPILDENGNVKFALMALMDMTHQKDTTQSLREREEFFRNLFEEGPIAMNLSFPDTSIASVNRAFSEMLGYSKDELIGKSFLALTHPDDIASDRSLAKKLFDKVLPRYQLEKRFMTKSGSAIWCKVSASSILDMEGTPLFRLAIVENITEQRESEIALRESGERFRSLAESANDAIISSDSTGAIVFFNPAAERIFGYSLEEIKGKSIRSLMSESSWKDNFSRIQNYLGTGEASLPGSTLELTGRHKDGREFPAEISYFSWKTNSGLFFTAIMRDITERKQIDDMKRDLISVVSHQLKTPVAEINGYIENLLEGLAGDLTQKQREYLSDMRDIGTENYRLISDLLNMSKIERGVITVEPEPIALSEILELALRDYEDTIKRKGLELTVKSAQKPITVLADRDKTVETIRNIVNNAVKCTDKGGITLQVHSDNGSTLVEIRDTGIGMGPEALSKIFTRERVMGQEAARAGAGLGLYIAKSFMNLQNGDITVKSEVGKGTSFFVKIPNIK